MLKRPSTVNKVLLESNKQLVTEEESLQESLVTLARIQIADAFQKDLQDMFTGRVKDR